MLIPFNPPPGFNSDDTTFAAEGRWADGNNVRFWEGRAQVVGGYKAYFAGTVAGICKTIFCGASNLAGLGVLPKLVYATTTKLYMGAGAAAPTDVTPASAYPPSAMVTASIAAWGNDFLVNPSGPAGGKLFYLTSFPVAAATAVATAPALITSMIVTGERQVLAFGCSEEVSGTFNPLCIRGSDLEDYTDWTTTATNNVFEHILEDPTEIVAGRAVGQYAAVWTKSALYLGQFLGDPGQTYRFDRVAFGCGLLGHNAVAVVGGGAYWIGSDLQLYAWAGPGSIPVAVPCPISKDFIDNFAPTDFGRVKVAYYAAKSEIWIAYRDGRDSVSHADNTRYLALHLVDGNWFRGQLAASTIFDPQGFYRDSTLPADYFLRAEPNSSSNSTIYAHEYKAGSSGATFPTWHLQSADQYLDNSQRRMMVKGVIPDFEDQAGDVSLTLFCRDRPQSTAVTKGPYTLTTASTKKDFRASGKIIAVKLSGATYMRLGKPCFDAVPLGER